MLCLPVRNVSAVMEIDGKLQHDEEYKREFVSFCLHFLLQGNKNNIVGIK